MQRQMALSDAARLAHSQTGGGGGLCVWVDYVSIYSSGCMSWFLLQPTGAGQVSLCVLPIAAQKAVVWYGMIA